MTIAKSKTAMTIAGMVFALSFLMVGAASALTVSCAGAPSNAGVIWTASSSGGVAPIAYLWGNGSTSTSQTIVQAVGTHSMTIQATDASSTVASSTCSVTIAQPVLPSISLFLAAPSDITVGQSAKLSWSVSNASSTSINNGVGTISSTSVTVSPTVTTTYTLTAVNPNGTTTANATVTVNPSAATTTNSGGLSVAAQIQALLAQIAGLKAQITQLVAGSIGGGNSGTSTTTPPTGGNGGACLQVGRDIRRGDYGDDIKDLQKFLAKHPGIYPEGIVNGFYGPLTMQAVKRWQKQNGIEATGFFGPLSRKFWKNQICTGTFATSTVSGSASSTIADWIQQAVMKKMDDKDNNKGKGKGNGRDDDDNDDDDRNP